MDPAKAYASPAGVENLRKSYLSVNTMPIKSSALPRIAGSQTDLPRPSCGSTFFRNSITNIYQKGASKHYLAKQLADLDHSFQEVIARHNYILGLASASLL